MDIKISKPVKADGPPRDNSKSKYTSIRNALDDLGVGMRQAFTLSSVGEAHRARQCSIGRKHRRERKYWAYTIRYWTEGSTLWAQRIK